MKVEYTLTPEDYAAVMHERIQNSPGKPRWPRYLSSVSVIMVVLSQGAFLVVQGVPWPVVTGICLLLAVLLFAVYRFLGPAIFKVSMAGMFRRARTPGMNISLEARPEGLAVTTGATASLTAWEGVDRIVVSDTHAFFYVNNFAAHILPRRAFADEGGFDEFVESARSYQEAAKVSSEAKQL
jgi:hypothetical protein